MHMAAAGSGANQDPIREASCANLNQDSTAIPNTTTSSSTSADSDVPPALPSSVLVPPSASPSSGDNNSSPSPYDLENDEPAGEDTANITDDERIDVSISSPDGASLVLPSEAKGAVTRRILALSGSAQVAEIRRLQALDAFEWERENNMAENREALDKLGISSSMDRIIEEPPLPQSRPRP